MGIWHVYSNIGHDIFLTGQLIYNSESAQSYLAPFGNTGSEMGYGKQTLEAIWSGSALFAKAYLSENLGSLR